jgi:KDO2-lipid IV(A) lauroyltransferase
MIFFLRFLQFCFQLIFLLPAVIALAFMHACAWVIQAAVKLTPFKKKVMNNINLILPASQASVLAEKLISNTAYTILEVLCLPFFRKKHYRSTFSFEGLDNLNQALTERKGAILLTAHTGNYEGAFTALSYLDYKMNAILRATKEPVFEIVNRARSCRGGKLINVLDQDMFRESLRVLGQNELVYLLADTGALESRHEQIDFLGKKVPVATGWLTLAQRAECPVIPILSKKNGKKNTIILYPPLKVNKGNREQILQKSIGIFEDFINQNPEQWAMFLNGYETQRMVNGE